jgi:hypothetical protein
MGRGAGVLKVDRARPVMQLAAAHLVGEQCGPTSPAAAHPRSSTRGSARRRRARLEQDPPTAVVLVLEVVSRSRAGRHGGGGRLEGRRRREGLRRCVPVRDCGSRKGRGERVRA